MNQKKQKLSFATLWLILAFYLIDYCLSWSRISFLNEQLNQAMACIGYLLPIVFFTVVLMDKEVPWRRALSVLSFFWAVFGVFGFISEITYGDIGFSYFHKNQPDGQNWVNVCTIRKVLQRDFVQDTMITLEKNIFTWDPPERQLDLTYSKVFLGILKQDKVVCRVMNCTDGRYVISEDRKQLILGPVPQSKELFQEQTFSTDFNSVRPVSLESVQQTRKGTNLDR